MLGTHKPQSVSWRSEFFLSRRNRCGHLFYFHSWNRPKELVPKLVYRNEVIQNGSDILTDDFIVKVILSAQVEAAANRVLVCKHFDFPSESLHLGQEEGLRQLKSILTKSVCLFISPAALFGLAGLV